MASEQASSADTLAAFIEAWNSLTSPPIGRCRELTALRSKHIRARLRDRPLAEWCEVFARVNASSFCRGGGAHGWKASIDWILRPDSGVKVLEGKYDDPAPPPPPQAWRDICREIHEGQCMSLQEHSYRLIIDARPKRDNGSDQ